MRKGGSASAALFPTYESKFGRSSEYLTADEALAQCKGSKQRGVTRAKRHKKMRRRAGEGVGDDDSPAAATMASGTGAMTVFDELEATIGEAELKDGTSNRYAPLPHPVCLSICECVPSELMATPGKLHSRGPVECSGSRAQKRQREAAELAEEDAQEAQRKARYEHAIDKANRKAVEARQALTAAQAEEEAGPVGGEDEDESLDRTLAMVRIRQC
jgi:hypothetical protein